MSSSHSLFIINSVYVGASSEWDSAALARRENGPTVANILQAAKYMAMAALAIAIWDWCISFPTEYARVWKGSWTLAKLLYLFNRYWTIAAHTLTFWLINQPMSSEACSHLFRLHVALPMWSTLSSEAILALRAYVFLGGDKRVLALLSTLFIGECVFLLYVVFQGVFQVSTPGVIGPCGSAGPPDRAFNYVTGYFIAPVIFDFFVTILILMKAIQLRRSGLRSSSDRIFVREGLFYFLLITTFNFINLAFFTQPSQPLQAIMAQPTIQLSSILSCRLVLAVLERKKAQAGNVFFFQTGFEIDEDASAPEPPPLPMAVNRTRKDEGQASGNHLQLLQALREIDVTEKETDLLR